MTSVPLPRRAIAALAAAAALACGPAVAHQEHGRPVHGGVVAEAGAFQGELVAAPSGPVLYVTEHGKPVPTAGATGRLVVLAGTQRNELVLAPAGGNRLAPAQSAALPKGAKAVATVTLKDGRNGSMRFEVR